MLDTPDTLYAAIESRDPRFDGRFFSGITSTGIYCRPVCPARTPNRENVRFFASAAAAVEAGFRACLRCRPESAPGGAAWSGTASTVRRAVRLIEAGALHDGSVGQLAERLGVSERHLRRLFVTHLGASPVAISQAQRLAGVRWLLQNTQLPMHALAHDAGFRSVRRFNDAVRKATGRTPTALREGGRPTLTLQLAYRPPFDFDALLHFLAARAPRGVERAADGVWERVVGTADDPGLLRVRQGTGHRLEVQLPSTVASEVPGIVRRLRRLFDLDADPAAIASVLSDDPRLLPLLEARPGVRIPGAYDGFELCVRAVLGQQISVVAANTLFARLVERWGPEVDVGSVELNRLFPTPDLLVDAPFELVGVMPARAKTLRNLARLAADGDLDLAPRASLQAWVDELCKLPGIGPWTAHYVALRVSGEPDAFPSADVGLRRAARPAPIPAAELSQEAEAWRPWRGYAALLLWSAP